jgi:hypothetical protein
VNSPTILKCGLLAWLVLVAPAVPSQLSAENAHGEGSRSNIDSQSGDVDSGGGVNDATDLCGATFCEVVAAQSEYFGEVSTGAWHPFLYAQLYAWSVSVKLPARFNLPHDCRPWDEVRAAGVVHVEDAAVLLDFAALVYDGRCSARAYAAVAEVVMEAYDVWYLVTAPRRRIMPEPKP